MYFKNYKICVNGNLQICTFNFEPTGFLIKIGISFQKRNKNDKNQTTGILAITEK